MKLKKILAVVLCVAMVLGTMGTVTFAENDVTGNYVAKIGDVPYATLQEAVNAAVEGDTIYLFGEIEETTGVLLPSVMKDVTIDGQGTAVIKNTSISRHYGNSVNYENLTIKDTIFDNGHLVLGGVLNGDVIYKNLVIEGNKFENIVDTDNTAAVHMNIASEDNEYVENFTFKNNVISGVTGSYNSGLLVTNVKGNVLIEGNTISDVAWNAIQLKNAKPGAVITIKDNTLSAGADEGVLNLFGTNCKVILDNNTFNTFAGQPEFAYMSHVAKIDDVYYATLQEAIKNAQEGETVELIADATVEEWQYMDAKNITIDGNNCSLTVNAITQNTINNQGSLIRAMRGSLAIKDIIVNLCPGAVVAQVTAGNMENVTVNGGKYGFLVDGATTIKNCEFNSQSGTAIYFRDVDGAPGSVVDGCTFNLSRSRATCLWTNEVFTNNTINGADGLYHGLTILASSTATVSGNTLDSDSPIEIYVMGDTQGAITLTKNVIEGAVFTDGAAITTQFENSTIENNTLSDAALEGLKGIDESIESVDPVAKINGKNYYSIDDAIEAAEEGDIINILEGEYDAFTVPADKNDLTFIGETDAEGNNLVTIRTLEEDIATATKGIYVQAEKATFKNLNIVSGDKLVKWCCSALGKTNNSLGLGHSYLNDLAVESCNFVGNGSTYAIWVNACDITIKDCTFDGYTKPIEFYALGADQTVTVTGTEITNASQAIRAIEGQEGSLVKLENSVISAEQITVNKDGKMTIKDSTVNGAYLAAYGNSELSVANSALYDTKPYTAANTASVSLRDVYVNNVNELAQAAKAENITFTTYYKTYEDFEAKTGLADVPSLADAIFVELEKASEAEGEKVYNINLTATEGDIINRLNSVDLDFILTQVNGENDFEIIASNEEVVINAVDNSKTRYEFHYDGKTDVETDTDVTITIGQVKFTGYGEFAFAVNTNATTNVAHTTKIANNIVDTFIPDGDTTILTNGELVIDNATTGNVVIAVPDRNLGIKIDFPNAVVDNDIAYQDMKVVISGGDLAEDITIDLGEDAQETALDIFGKVNAKYAASMVDGSYVINVTDALTVNNAYTVTVSGAGYRTARYTVTMTNDKQLNFWNNVMDKAQVVEIGKDSSAVKVTFLAGDIVKDNKINIYDLSAVVSYFGTETETDSYDAYAKYDLNRDGVIDSKDVAYVLVSWGE